jgi:hypothetical protein
MITADQILAHLVGDYLLQSNWMAREKTRQSFAAAVHAATYTTPFAYLVSQSLVALSIIAGTHFLIDRFRLARWIVWIKNGESIFESPTDTGYPLDMPPWLSTWLFIIADNTLHLICNGLALELRI